MARIFFLQFFRGHQVKRLAVVTLEVHFGEI